MLVVGGIAAFFVVRSMQQRRLLDLRLQLARNFHDQIGPMLLYGSVLAKKRGDEEMREHISLIMDAVRDISHDLKSSELSTVGSFGKEVSGLLEKVEAATEIGYSLNVSNGSQILAYGQLTQLQAIVQELISNSIKHAECRTMTGKVSIPVWRRAGAIRSAPRRQLGPVRASG
jgi:signal transduction histidine kinase